MKIVALVIGAVAVVVLLFTVVFPRIDAMIDDPAIEAPSE